MTQLVALQTAKLELLRQLFAAATRNASLATCRWTNSLVRLTLDEVQELPLADICGELGIADELLTTVVLDLEGELGGTIMLMFDGENGRGLAALLTRMDVGATDCWSELERSALTETGNILGCAYVSAIARLIDRELVPRPPYFIQDYGASMLQQALLTQADASDAVLVCRTMFHHEGGKLDWLLLFVPTAALRTAIEDALNYAP